MKDPENCDHDDAEQMSTETKVRPERIGEPRKVWVCQDCGEVL